MSKKGVAWTVCRFKEGFGKKEEVVFLRGGGGVDTPMDTLILLKLGNGAFKILFKGMSQSLAQLKPWDISQIQQKTFEQ